MTDRVVDLFHLKRIMFLIAPNGTTFIHPGPTTDSHETWAARLGLAWTEVASDWVRGFYWSDTDSVYVYGSNLDYTVSLFQIWAERLRRTMQLHPRTRVWAGMKPGKLGELWEPIHDLGTFGTLHGITLPKD